MIRYTIGGAVWRSIGEAVRPTIGGMIRTALCAVFVLGAPASAQSFLLAKPASAQSVFEDSLTLSEADRGLDHLYGMEFGEARRLFDQIDQRYPWHPVGPFLLALNTWWKILPDLSNEEHDEAFYASMKEVIERSDRLLKHTPDHFDALFFKGAALGFRGRLRSNRGEWFKSARDGMKALKYIRAVAGYASENADYAFGQGIYDYYAAAMPDKHPFLKPLMVFFPDGNRERGIRTLERTVRAGRFIRTEAAYFLLQIYYMFENDFDRSLHYVTWLRERHPGNAFFHVFEGRVYARWGQWRTARSIFEAVVGGFEAGREGYDAALAAHALYYVARSHMAYGEYDAALTSFHALKVLEARNDEHGTYEVLGRLYEGMSYDALGRRSDAVASYRQVLGMRNLSGAHERAKRYLNTPFGS